MNSDYQPENRVAGQDAGTAMIKATASLRPKGALDRFGSVPFALKRHISPHGQVTAVSMMKDEGPFLIEWIAHHLAVGFTDLLVYTNDCSDGTDDMLIRLEELGLAHHRRNDIPTGLRPQPSALNYAQEDPVVQQSDWVMVFDADEFLSIRYGCGRLDGMITAAKAQGANGIVVTWRIFGSGGVIEWSRAPVTEQYLMAAPTTWNKGWGVKTLFTFDPNYWKLGIHRPKMKNRHIKTDFPDTVKWLTGSGAEMEDYFKFRGWRSITRTVGYDWAQLNHYAVKSVDSYAIRKMRGNVNNKADKYNSDYWSLQDRNEVRDDTMLRYTADRNRIISELLQDPVLNRLHFAAIDRAEARLTELRKTDAYHGLVADLARASAVPITGVVAKPPQPRDREKIASLMSDVEKRRNESAKAKRSAEPRKVEPAAPQETYTSAQTAWSDDPAVEWVANHTVMLPLDPRVFTALALTAIRDGKFGRSIARKMPQVLAKGARVLEIGSAVGFLGAHLANSRPDLWITLQEDNPGLRKVLLRVCDASGRAFGVRFVLSDAKLGADPGAAALALIAALRPEVLLLSDPRLSPEVLAGLLPALPIPAPEQIILHGRLLEKWHGQIAETVAVLQSLGFSPEAGFESGVAQSFRMQHTLDDAD